MLTTFSKWEPRIVCALAGWILTMAGLSALQNYVNSSTEPNTRPLWWADANLPRLGAGTIFRLQWLTWVWTAITIVTLALAFASAVIGTTRLALVGFSTVAALLNMVSANTCLDVVSQHISPAHTSAARTASAGYIISAIAFLALIYSVGLVHSAPRY